MNSSGREQWSPRGLAYCVLLFGGGSSLAARLTSSVQARCCLGSRERKYLEGISWLTLEGNHIIHQVAFASLHPVTGHSRLRTATQAYGWMRQTDRQTDVKENG